MPGGKNPPGPGVRPRGARRCPATFHAARPRGRGTGEARPPLGPRRRVDRRGPALGRASDSRRAWSGPRSGEGGRGPAWPSRPRPRPPPPSFSRFPTFVTSWALAAAPWRRGTEGGIWWAVKDGGRRGAGAPAGRAPGNTGETPGTRTNFPVTPRRIPLPLASAAPPGAPRPSAAGRGPGRVGGARRGPGMVGGARPWSGERSQGRRDARATWLGGGEKARGLEELEAKAW